MSADKRRFVILFNGAATEEICVCCEQRFILPVGYQTVAQDGNAPAMATLPVCRPCVRECEPGLVDMLELADSYARFGAGQDSTMQDRSEAVHFPASDGPGRS